MRAFRGTGCKWMSMRRLSNSLLVLVLCILPTSCSPSPGKISDGVSLKATATRSAEPILPTVTAARPQASPTAQGECQEKAGEVRSLTYPGAVFDEDVQLTVYLPPCHSSSNERYPSLYLLHGYPQDEQHWETLGVIDLVEEGILAGKWPPILLILPNQPEPLFTKTDGGPGSYEQEMIDGLVPFIDETFRTLAEPQSRAIAGVSRGGVWALEIALRNPDVFNSVAALSPSLHVNHPRAPYDPFNIAGGDNSLPEMIFISGGAGEPLFLAKIELFVQHLTEEGISHTFLFSDGNHTDESWEGILPEVIQFIMQSWE
jgi:enterochelin esterase-like enzyme